MINFRYADSELQERLSAYKTSFIKPCIVICVLSVFVSMFVALFAISMKKWYIFAFDSVLIAIILTAIFSFAFAYCNHKNRIINCYLYFMKDEFLNYSISKENDVFTVKITDYDKALFEFKKSEIKKIIKAGKIILVKLKSKEVVDLPNHQAILDFLK